MNDEQYKRERQYNRSNDPRQIPARNIQPSDMFPVRNIAKLDRHTVRQNSAHIHTQQPSTSTTQSNTSSRHTKQLSAVHLARQRTALGFDDIPIEPEINDGYRLSVISSLFAALKRIGYRLFTSFNYKKVWLFLKQRKFLDWIDDAKWALRADKDDDTPPPSHQRVQHNPGTAYVNGHRQVTSQLPAHVTHSTKTINIKISFGELPSFPKLPRLPKISPSVHSYTTQHRNKFYILISCFVLIVIGYQIYVTIQQNSSHTTSQVISTEDINQKPSYTTLHPADKSSTDISWKRVSPPSSDPVFAYADTIENIPISVSQQPIPESFKKDLSGSIATLAKNYSATEKITAGSMTVYVGTSAKGPQSAIFAKNNVLVLIKSQSKIESKHWARYAELLR